MKTPKHPFKYKFFFALIVLTLFCFTNGCTSSAMSRRVSHAGFSVVVPSDWGDYTGTQSNKLAVARIWGSASFSIEKLPGESETLLALYRKTMSKEEPVDIWHGLKGHGFKFQRESKEAILFFPEEKFLGWYFKTAIDTDETGSQKALDSIFNSLRCEIASNKP